MNGSYGFLLRPPALFWEENLWRLVEQSFFVVWMSFLQSSQRLQVQKKLPGSNLTSGLALSFLRAVHVALCWLCYAADLQTFLQNLTRTKSSTKLDRNTKKTVKDQSKASGDVQESGDGRIIVTRLVQNPLNAMSEYYRMVQKKRASGCSLSNQISCHDALACNFTECWPIFRILVPWN